MPWRNGAFTTLGVNAAAFVPSPGLLGSHWGHLPGLLHTPSGLRRENLVHGYHNRKFSNG